MPNYIIRAMGVKQAATRFTRMGEAGIAAQPAMEAVAAEMMRIIGVTFQSQGRRGGGSWRHLTTEWLMRKQRNNLDPRIGYATHALVNSVTKPGADRQILEIGPHSVQLGSLLPYAATQQRHRPFVKFTLNDRHNLALIVKEWLIAAWKAPVA